jgi:hypothetical protein
MPNNPSLSDATDSEICEYFDLHPNLTVVELARRTGKTVPEVKRILLAE